eukprot:TRINITY_DN21736_c0_g1_i2.p1 TRINITY_DN21736_c0_g1~~TRINITY_DN21736_c0_g1_i2.p1  ORF type:complete len:804 (+),score=239.58 TRINITY_DN21736_c0_g1_i2:60-2414(+)
MHEPSLRELTATYYGGAEEAASLSYRRYREKVKGWDRPEGGLAVGDRVRFTRMYTHGPSRVFAGDSAVVVRGGDGGEDVDVCLADGTTVPLPSGYAEFAGKSAEKEESVQLTVRAESASGLAGDHDSKLLLSCGAGVWATGTRASRSPRWNEAFTTALPIDGLPATIRCEAHADGGCVGVGTAVVTATAAEGLPVVMRLRPPPDRSLPLTTSTGGCGRVHLRAVAQRRTAKQLCDSGAAEVLGGVRRGAVRAADWVGSAVGRMRCYDAGLRFVSEARGEMAAAVAEGRDAALLRGGARALEGLPFGVSDRIDVGCVRTRVGAADHVPGRSAAVVRAATAAGAVFVAKLRSNPLQRTAAGVSPAAAAAGCPRLPHDPTLPAGNGCSGCAVAVSCGAVACAFGVDAFGGCRLPSALCGVACLKPAADRYGGAAGVVESVPAAEAVCLMARTVRDVAAIDSALAATPEASPPLAPPRFGVAPHRPAALSQQAAGVWQSVCSPRGAAPAAKAWPEPPSTASATRRRPLRSSGGAAAWPRRRCGSEQPECGRTDTLAARRCTWRSGGACTRPEQRAPERPAARRTPPPPPTARARSRSRASPPQCPPPERTCCCRPLSARCRARGRAGWTRWGRRRRSWRGCGCPASSCRPPSARPRCCRSACCLRAASRRCSAQACGALRRCRGCPPRRRPPPSSRGRSAPPAPTRCRRSHRRRGRCSLRRRSSQRTRRRRRRGSDRRGRGDARSKQNKNKRSRLLAASGMFTPLLPPRLASGCAAARRTVRSPLPFP